MPRASVTPPLSAKSTVTPHAAPRSPKRMPASPADRTEAHGAHETATLAVAELPASHETEIAARQRAQHHGRAPGICRAGARRSAALAREAELADRRVQAIVAERKEWQGRKENAGSQIAIIETRINDLKTERAGAR